MRKKKTGGVTITSTFPGCIFVGTYLVFLAGMLVVVKVVGIQCWPGIAGSYLMLEVTVSDEVPLPPIADM